MGIQSTSLRPSVRPLPFLVRSPWKQHGLYIGIIAIIAPNLFRMSKKCSEGSNVSTAVLPLSLMVLKVLSGPHNLRSFLAANSTQNHFLIAHMLSFLWHLRHFATKWDNFWYRKWIERKEIKGKWGNVENLSPFPHSLSISSPFPHFLSISSSFSHSLSIFSQPGCQAATSCATLCLVYWYVSPLLL